MPGTAEYDALITKVDAFSHQAHKAQEPWLACRKGCDGCCRLSRSALAVELGSIRKYLANQEPALRRKLVSRLRQPAIQEGDRCVFLNESGCCDVYPVRPIICRTHGPALRLPDQRLAWCELNFDGLDKNQVEDLLPPGAVLDVNLVNQMLALINQQYLKTRDETPHAPLTAVLESEGNSSCR